MKDRFRELLDEFALITEEVLVVRSLKARADELINIASVDRNGRGAYVEWLQELLDEDYSGPWELLPYVVFRLRWPELLSQAKYRLRLVEEEGRLFSSYGRYLEAVVEAYDDDWPDIDLWE
jgi:hypothetical protein